MEYFKNKPETFFREIRSIEIYKSSDISYIDNYNGVFPKNKNPLYKFDIIAETFSRNIKTKKKDGSYFFEIDLGFPLLDLSKTVIDKCFANFNKKDFAVVLTSNTEKLMLGNYIEPLLVEFIEGKKDDNSGEDECNFSITGETVIAPKTEIL
jgi:hypothetical protein